MNMDNMIEKAKENKMTIFGVVGAIFAAFLGKKVIDKRRGSGAYRFQIPMNGSKMPEEEAFFAFKQRGGFAPDGRELNRMQWMNQYAEGGYVKGAHGKNAYGQDHWSSWSEKLIPGQDEGQWSGGTPEDSSVFGGVFGSSLSDYEDGAWSGASETETFSADFYPEVPKF